MNIHKDFLTPDYYMSDPVSESKLEETQKNVDDKHRYILLTDFLAEADSEGFERILEEEFNHGSPDRLRRDAFYIFAHRDGWLLIADTFTFDDGIVDGVDEGFSERYLNKADLYYNSIITNADAIGFGCNDVREGLSRTMAQLTLNGEILTPWVRNDIVWFAPPRAVKVRDISFTGGEESYLEEGDRWIKEMDEISKANFDKLPEWVKTMIGGHNQ